VESCKVGHPGCASSQARAAGVGSAGIIQLDKEGGPAAQRGQRYLGTVSLPALMAHMQQTAASQHGTASSQMYTWPLHCSTISCACVTPSHS
jgi:hypothetical protein